MTFHHNAFYTIFDLFVFVVIFEMVSHCVAQASFKLLRSRDLPTWVAGTTGVFNHFQFFHIALTEIKSVYFLSNFGWDSKIEDKPFVNKSGSPVVHILTIHRNKAEMEIASNKQSG